MDKRARFESVTAMVFVELYAQLNELNEDLTLL
jgi:hypothetical protein